MALRILGWLSIPLAAAALGYYYYAQEDALAVTAQSVSRGMVEETVAAIASGTVMPAKKSMVAAAAMGVIAHVHVEEGNQVRAGDLLVELEHEELDAQLELARANLRVGQSREAQARVAAGISQEVSVTQVNQATVQLEQAQSEYNRLKALWDKQAISRSELDRAATALRLAEEARSAAVSGKKENLLREEDIRSAEAGLEQLAASVRVAEAMREKAFVRAPFDGVVARIMLERGESVAMGLPLLHLVQAGDCYVEAPFDEANAGQIRVGLEARIEVDAYPGESFPGTVDWVSPVVSINEDLSRTVNIKVRVADGHGKLLPGMSADATLITERKEAALYVPSESLVRDEFAYVIEEGVARERPVALGIGNWETQEVVSGLREGDTIITSVAIKELEDGVPVRVVEDL